MKHGRGKTGKRRIGKAESKLGTKASVSDSDHSRTDNREIKDH